MITGKPQHNYKDNTGMYVINPFRFGFLLDMEPFIAPAGFSEAAQPVNLRALFSKYYAANSNARYIYAFTSSINTLTLPAVANRLYRYGETIGGTETIADVTSGTIFTAGSTNRWVLVYDTSTTLSEALVNGTVWAYLGKYVKYMYGSLAVDGSIANNYLKYIHFEKLANYLSSTIGSKYGFRNCPFLEGILNTPPSWGGIGIAEFASDIRLSGAVNLTPNILTVNNAAFSGCTGLNSTVTVNDNVTTLGQDVFRNCSSVTRYVIGSGVTSIGFRAFDGNAAVTRFDCRAATAPSVFSGALTMGGAARPLHIPVVNSGYNVAPWTGTSIFSSIIADL